jgi:malate dehydrogenase
VTTAVIIGAGDLGGALARRLAAGDVVKTVVLVEETGSVAQGKALDIRQAGPVDGSSTTVTGSSSLEAIIGATFIVIADRSHAPGGEWQDDEAVGLMTRIARLNQTAPIVCAGARQLTLVVRSIREVGIERLRIFGSAPEALRSAVMGLTALEAGCAATDISLTVVGRPPNQIIVPWEDASIAGRRATAVLTPPALTRLDGRLPKLWPPGPMTLAAAAARAISSALTRTPRAISAFVAVTRDGSALQPVGMLPVRLSTRGVDEVLSPSLSSRDRVRMETALSS